MKKYLPHILISLVLVVTFFGSVSFANAQSGFNPNPPNPNGSGIAKESQVNRNDSLLGGLFDFTGTILSPLGYLIMKLVSYVTALSGIILNATIYYTVIQMAQNFSNIPAIDIAWKVVRDLANMTFIFILLYAAIKTIIGEGADTRGLIVRMIIAAILINFSLFFTKFIIDIANLLALTFYNAIAPQAALGPDNFLNAGLSNSIMEPLRVQSLWAARGSLSGSNIFITAILSSVVLLITAFVFFAVSIMFITRYVILIFVLILSPLMFVANILPGIKTYAERWWKALIGQAFFAPVYFLLTWITVLLIQSISATTLNGTALAGVVQNTEYTPGAIPTIINFVVIIFFLVFSLIISKGFAGKTGDGLTKLMSNAAGKATFGIAGGLGRSTVGRLGQKMADSEYLNKRAPTSRLARLALATGQKTAASSFDARSSKFGESLGSATGISFGKGAGKGGFTKEMDERAKAEKNLAESFKPSDLVINDAERKLDEAKKVDVNTHAFDAERASERLRREQKITQINDELTKARSAGAPIETIKKIEDRKTAAEESYANTMTNLSYRKDKVDQAQARVDELKGVSEDEARKREIRQMRIATGDSEKVARKKLVERETERFKKIGELMRNQNMSEKEAKEEATRLGVGWAPEEIKSATTVRKEAYAGDIEKAETLGLPMDTGRVLFFGPVSKESRTAAMQIRKTIKDKKPSEKIAEQIAQETKSAAEDNESDSGAQSTPTTPSTPPPSPASPAGAAPTP